MIDFSRLTSEDLDSIQRIAARTHTLVSGLDHLSLTMDLGAAHIACPMRLDDLAEADDFNFLHDVGGIMRHIDRTTGELTDCFVPRFAS